MEILPFLSSDLPYLTDLQPEGWPEIFPEFQYYVHSSFCFPIKVIVDEKVVGIGASIHRDGKTAWLAHIIVHPAYRQRGIGFRITQHLVTQLQAQYYTTLSLIATEAGYPVYNKIGFRTETEYIFFQGNLLVTPSAPSPFLVPCTAPYRNEVMQMDRLISGENREVQLAEHLSDAFLYVKNGQIEGGYFPTWGEGLIIATSTHAGLELMALRLQKHDRAVLPKENRLATQFLLMHQFQEVRRAYRMVLGEQRPWYPSMVYNRIKGALG